MRNLVGHAICEGKAVTMKNLSLLTSFSVLLLLPNCREAKQNYAAAKLQAATAGDVTFARTTFESLARGDSAVA